MPTSSAPKNPPPPDKSVNFSQYPIHSDTSSINDGTTTIGNQSVTTEKPKSILKNKKDSNFNRNDVFGASIRRGVSDNDHPGDRSFNKQFSHKSRRVKSIEQGLNKSWGGPKGQGNGYYWAFEGQRIFGKIEIEKKF